MKKYLPLIYAIILIPSLSASAQSLQWAYTMGTDPRSQAVAVKEDHSGNFYVASFTDSVGTRVSTQLEKRDGNHQLQWQIHIDGEATITDIEINVLNHVVVAGYFLDTIVVDGNGLTSFSPSDNSGFLFEADENGLVQWIRTLNPVSGDFKPNDLFIATDSNMYLTSEVSGSFGFCAFHKLNSLGVITKNEFNFNFEDRTFSRVLADADGNVYLSGTCGNGAIFDTIHADPTFSYQNFLVKYDSSFKAQWLMTKEYITFDNNNSLSSSGQNLYWAFNDFTAGADTVRIIQSDFNGQVLTSIAGPLGNSFFPSLDFAVGPSGNGLLAMNVFTRIFLFRYDNSFNITWQDTILTGTSGFPFYHGLSVYDSSFYLASYYMYDTLTIDHSTMLINPNAAANFPSDIFVAKWGNPPPVAINPVNENDRSILVFPNPATQLVTVIMQEVKGELTAYDFSGKEVFQKVIENEKPISLDVSSLSTGIYLFRFRTEKETFAIKMVKE